jgi:hypothetical protein
MRRFKLAFVVVCTLAAIAVAGGSAADSEADSGPVSGDAGHRYSAPLPYRIRGAGIYQFTLKPQYASPFDTQDYTLSARAAGRVPANALTTRTTAARRRR